MMRHLPALFSLLLIASPVSAQVRPAELGGIATDESGAVLPGVAITASQVGTGVTRTAVTDERGAYHFNALPVGVYSVRAELPGFAPLEVQDFTLGVGASAVLDLRLKLAGTQETVTVKAEAALIDTTKSDLSGKVDQRQVEGLPINGRNWIVFATLAPGVKSEGVEGSPSSGIGDAHLSQVFLDGASVQNRSTRTEIDVQVSKEIIDQFEVLTNRFDAQLGHAGTTVVNAVTKSGTDVVHGSGFLYFRDDSLNAADFFTHQVEPYQNKQYGGTVGGPVLKGKTHFFVNYERQTEPKTVSSNSGFPLLDVPVDGTDVRNLYFARIDQNITKNNRLSGTFNGFTRFQPNNVVGGAITPSTGLTFDWTIKRYGVSLDSVLADRWVNRALFTYLDTLRHFRRSSEGPLHSFPSLSIGGLPNAGDEIPSYYFVRDDVAHFLEKGGQHNLKFGGEYEHGNVNGFFAFAANGIFEYDQDPPNLATCCVGLDQSTWDKSKFPAPIRYTQALGDFTIEAPNDIVGAYAQDDWKVNPRVTLNLGLRWDAEFGSLANDQTGLITKPHATPKANFQPRLGFAWDVSGSGTTIVRGGAGLYYDQVYLNVTFDQRRTNTGQQITVTTFNPNHDPSFASNPLGGKSFEDFKKTAGAANVSVIAPDATQPHVWTGAIGVAHQITPALGVSADYVYQRSDNMLRSVDANLFCCTSNGNALPIQSGFFPELGGQVTGVGRPDSRFNIIQRFETNGLARYHGLQVAVNKRWSSNYQFVATYLLSQNRDDQNGAYSYPNNQFNLADEYGTSLADQRHRFVFNWVGRLPYDFTLSSVLYMAGGRPIAASTGGVDINGDGLAVSPQGGSFLGGDRPICGTDPQFDHGCAVLGIPNGQRVPRNALRSAPVYRFDLRVSRRFHIPRVMIEPMLEVFNLFNRENFDPAAYNNSLASAQFGQPGRSAELPYQPRQIQLAIRAQF